MSHCLQRSLGLLAAVLLLAPPPHDAAAQTLAPRSSGRTVPVRLSASFAPQEGQERSADDPAGSGQSSGDDSVTIPLPGGSRGPTAQERADLEKLLETGQGFGGVTVEGVDDRGVLILSGPKDQVDGLTRIIEEIQRLSDEADPEVRFVPLASADPVQLSQLAKRIYEAKIAARSEGLDTLPPLAFLPVARPPGVIVVGVKKELDTAVDILEGIDVGGINAGKSYEVIPLASVPASQVKAKIDEFFRNRAGADESDPPLGLRPRVEVVASQRGNALLVSGGPQDVKLVRELVRSLDEDTPGPTSTIRFFKLSQVGNARRVYNLLALTLGQQAAANATAQATEGVQGAPEAASTAAPAAETAALTGAPSTDLQSFGADAIGVRRLSLTVSGQGGRQVESGTLDDFRLVLDAFNNTIVAVAPAESMDLIEALIRRYDSPDSRATLDVIPLANAEANDVQTRLAPFFAQFANVVAIADDRTNSLAVYGDPAALAQIRQQIETLDRFTPTAVNQMQVVPLTNARASELAVVIQNALLGTNLTANQPTAAAGAAPAAPDTALRSNRVQFLGTDRNGNIVESGVLNDVTIVADDRANALLVNAPPESLPVILALIEQLDRFGYRERRQCVFRLKELSASQAAAALRQYLGQNPNATTGAGNVVGANLDQNIRDRLAQEITIVPVEIREEDEEGLEVNEGQDDSGGTDVTRSLLFTSNLLLISATPQFYDEILAIVQELDARPPMVTVNVLIAEVTLSDNQELGLELGTQSSVLFDRNIVVGNELSPGFNFNTPNLLPSAVGAPASEVGLQGLSNFALGRASNALGFGGLVLTASSDNVNVLLRALKRQQRLEVLSRPSITTHDNQPAFFQVGQKIRVNSDFTFDNNGNVINQLEEENVGVLLGVTPTVGPDGIVTLRIDPEVSSIAPGAGTAIGVDANGNAVTTPIINITRAITTVNVGDGQTVVLGGLITQTQTIEERKVPLLGDIPVLGWAFKTQIKTRVRRELLLILTPHVIYDDEDYQRVLDAETQRIDWNLYDVERTHGNIPITYRDKWEAEQATRSHLQYLRGERPELGPGWSHPPASPYDAGVPPTTQPLPPNSPVGLPQPQAAAMRAEHGRMAADPAGPVFPQPQAARPQQGMPTGAAPQYAVPMETMPQYGVPTGAMPQYGVPTGAMPQYGVPTGAMPQYGVPTGAMPQYGVPTGAMPQYGVPTGAMPQYGVPMETMPRQGVPADAMSQYGVPMDPMPRQGVPTDVPPRVVTPTVVPAEPVLDVRDVGQPPAMRRRVLPDMMPGTPPPTMDVPAPGTPRPSATYPPQAGSPAPAGPITQVRRTLVRKAMPGQAATNHRATSKPDLREQLHTWTRELDDPTPPPAPKPDNGAIPRLGRYLRGQR